MFFEVLSPMIGKYNLFLNISSERTGLRAGQMQQNLVKFEDRFVF